MFRLEPALTTTHVGLAPPDTTTDMPRAGWRKQARCRDMDPDFFEINGCGRIQLVALAACASCPVRADCLMESARFERAYGHDSTMVYAGMGPAARRTWAKENADLLPEYFNVLDEVFAFRPATAHDEWCMSQVAHLASECDCSKSRASEDVMA